MEYLIGKAKTLSSTHRDDRGTSLKVVSGVGTAYLILDAGGGVIGIVKLEGITYQTLFMAALENPPQYRERLEIQLGDDEDSWLTVYSSNRGDPYVTGVTITVGARPYSEDTGTKVSVFVEDSDVRRLWVALGGVEEEEE